MFGLIASVLDHVLLDPIGIISKVEWNELTMEKWVPTFMPFLGCGSYGDVYEARWAKEGERKHIAVKKFREDTDEEAIEKEVKNLMLVNHVNIIHIYGIVKDDNLRTVLLMEYADGGNLFNYLHASKSKENVKVIPYATKLNWMLQCAKGIAYLHDMNPKILHRDLKTHNLLLCNNFETLKICDFGTVRQLTTMMTKDVGTSHYMAPEVYDTSKYTEKCDVYSFAIIFWEVMSRKKPFYHLENHVSIAIKRKVQEGERPLSTDLDTDHIKELIQKCWHEDPWERPAMKRIVDIINIYAYYQNNTNPVSKVAWNDLSVEVPDMNEHIEWNQLTVEELGIKYGSYSDVYKAKWRAANKDNLMVAVKLKHFDTTDEIAKYEINYLSLVHHENILEFFGTTLDSGNIPYMLMEYADCGSLHNLLHNEENKHLNITYLTKINWMIQCARGIAHFHAKKMTHCNLQTHCLFLTNNFRTLKVSTTIMSNLIEGWPYMPPEHLNENGSMVGDKCDVYSYGVALWEIMTRKKPFLHLKKEGSLYILQSIKNGDKLPLNDFQNYPIPANICRIIEKCWDKEVSKRPTMNGLANNLRMDPITLEPYSQQTLECEISHLKCI